MRGVIAGSSIDGIATRTVVEKVVPLPPFSTFATPSPVIVSAAPVPVTFSTPETDQDGQPFSRGSYRWSDRSTTAPGIWSG